MFVPIEFAEILNKEVRGLCHGTNVWFAFLTLTVFLLRVYGYFSIQANDKKSNEESLV